MPAYRISGFHVGQMLQVALSDLKLIGSVPAVMNGAGNKLISVQRPKRIQTMGAAKSWGGGGGWGGLSFCNPR